METAALGSVYFIPTSVAPEPEFLETLALILVPLSYVYTFAATQGLISVIDDAYGHMFVVFLNACFFLPGLPCALLQSLYDLRIDAQYSSHVTFQIRMVLCFSILLTCTTLLSQERGRACMLVSTTFVGMATWLAHGTCTQLVQLFPPRAMVQVQLGFQLSNILALILVLAMRVTSYDINDSQIDYFYGIAAVIVVAGCFSWLAFLGRTADAPLRLELRDSSHILKAEDDDPDQPLLTTQSADLNSLPDEFAEPFNEGLNYCVLSIFINIFSSNLMGAFFAYIPKDEIGKIATVLVFCRLISDATSRFVAYIWRPSFCDTPSALFTSSVVRAASMAVFFAYAVGAFKADWFIMAFVFVSGFLSGILGTFSYVASREICLVLPEEYREEAFAKSSFRMNISFNSGGFVSSIVSIAIAVFIKIVT